MRAMLAMTMALAVTRATGARALTKPPLNTFVTSRPRVISAGLDPFVEATATEWFGNLGYLTLDSTTSMSAGTRFITSVIAPATFSGSAGIVN